MQRHSSDRQPALRTQLQSVTGLLQGVKSKAAVECEIMHTHSSDRQPVLCTQLQSVAGFLQGVQRQ